MSELVVVTVLAIGLVVGVYAGYRLKFVKILEDVRKVDRDGDYG